MTAIIITNGFVTVGGTDISAHVTSIELPFDRDEKEVTAMGDTSKTRIKGLKDGSIRLNFNLDAGRVVDALFWTEFLSDAVTAVVVRADGGVVGATNPQYGGDVMVTEFAPVNGTVGDTHAGSITWPTTGTWARTTA